MIIYKDRFTGDEVLSDAMKQVRVEEDGLILVSESYNVSKGGEDFGFENNDEEGGDLADAAEQVNIVVDSFQLVQTSMDKKSFQGYIKIYLKKVKAELEKSNPDRVEPFMTGMKAWVPKMLKEFSEYDFYMGRSCDGDAGYVYAKFGEGASYPTFYMIKDGLLEEKV
uniref:TCTP domain-containing protein n=1 Tax=Rhodosorus marinus TaxID=101924 RepID=A0A7S3ED54_9RHOD|mmetsp:Transcript_26720/g.103828  ORF Transcript_26720/g.103828 Transcript_26720/m.103828 type:complete len:167 (+) Transcript_26720:102-602(+)|eukprot:CAMPEP_0113957896 /NCGR_PEP_ID=MMETSP0011_2-20120614/3033_1 /TAXON_ID=101924 /ORGANISM="Rhodosorus marinus" /LENGTH=166 /DNA_ID=CAMNT_0000968527 /DNA_START=339 /DNA_END=839 /DNA_ORIENTATION=+ /assembly_acc=CAM_ASM_000156